MSFRKAWISVLEMTHFGPELILAVGIEFELAILGKDSNIT
jgi:hypothetical protein